MGMNGRVLSDAQEIVLGQIIRLVEFWGITEKELTDAVKVDVPRERGGVKYRHPKSGEEWDGVGVQPGWLKTALLFEGYRVAELKVDEGDTKEGA